MGTKEHYDNFLGNFYSWMTGDFYDRVNECQQFFVENSIGTKSNALAIDLGCGHGIQSVALANRGYKVISVDSSKQLLIELYQNKDELPVLIVENDIFAYLSSSQDTIPELIVCMGDTIAHLDSAEELGSMFTKCYNMLVSGGKFIISYRDYAKPLTGNSRFIPVKSDECRIFTCFLEYLETKVNVTDIVHEYSNGRWVQLVSSYQKLRLTEAMVDQALKDSGFKICTTQVTNRMIHTICEK